MNFVGWVRQLFSKSPPTVSGFRAVERPDGSRIFLDEPYMRYLESGAPEPTQASLQAVLARVTRVKVSAGGIAEGRCLSDQIVFTTDLPADIHALREALQIHEGSAGHCMCHGDTGILLFDGADRQIAALGVHHGHAIRWDHWKDDAALIDGWQLIDWLMSRGVPYPLSDEQIRERSLNRIAGFLGSPLDRVGRAIYTTWDRGTSVTLAVSGRDSEATFHFAFRSDQQAALHDAVRAYAAFACGSPYRVLLVPYSELTLWLESLQSITVSGGHSYWPIQIRETPEGLLLQRPPLQENTDLRDFLLADPP